MSLRFEYVLCKASGEPYAESLGSLGRTFTRRLNTPASAKITVRLDDPISAYCNPDNAPRLKIYRSATPAELAANPSAVRQLIFYGSLPPTGVSDDASAGTSEATFQDPRWILNQRFLPAPAVFATTDQAAILYSLLTAQNTRTGGDTFMTNSGANVTPTRDRTYDAGKNLAELINELTQVDGGPDVDCTAVDGYPSGRGMGVFTVFKQQGTDRPDAVFVWGAPTPDGTVGGLPTNVVNVKRSRGDVITQATFQGTDVNGVAITQTYGNPAGSGYGLAEYYETLQDVSQTTTLNEKAVGKVSAFQSPPSIWEVDTPLPNAPLPFVEYNVGDTVRLSVRRGSMLLDRQPVRVMSIDLTISQNGEVTSGGLVFV